LSESAQRAQARVATEHASKYLQQLCKHFQHKIPASFDAAQGAISFPSGEARLAAEPGALAIVVEAHKAEDLAGLQDVVARHLVRFAFKETLDVQWRAA
jgi:hypothetical protein